MLYVVSTPIGNLGDITYRAVEVLKSVDLIACEDTRKTGILCGHYGIATPLTSFYEYNKVAKGDRLLRLLKEGRTLALVSDAGTPGISDPGYTLIKSCLEAGIRVVAVPGPTALIAALSLSGFPANRFVFQGFLPAKSGSRLKRLKDLKKLNRDGQTVVLYESPHRVLKTLQDMQTVLGNPRIALVREVTKKFEEVVQGELKDVLATLRSSRPRGEFVIVF